MTLKLTTKDALRAVTPRAGLPDTLSQRVVDAATGWLSKRTSRRGFLIRASVVASALAVDSIGFLVKPGTAYAAVCGPGSTCSSGWTVFCATINNGINACPPGSLAAGWWKADGASLCGGKSRYIIDCNATCSRCDSGGRAGICSPDCWSCRCTCGPAGQCDNRRVCCNGFRYGQCNQQVSQVGGVHCRIVSCLPPWTFENCSTATATDNATRDHNSPALPSSWTNITARYVQLGEIAGPLGPTIHGQFSTPGGQAQRYVNGRMSWHPATGVHYTAGAIAIRYTELGAEASVLGYPVGDPGSINTSRASRFQHGRISYHPAHGACEVLGAIATRYMAAGSEPGALGFPLSRPIVAADGKGRATPFQRGRISWHPTVGGAKMLGVELARTYVSVKAENGRLGYPTSDQGNSGAVLFAIFQHGRIVYSTATGGVVLYTDLALAYVRSGGEKGPLGLPTGAEMTVTGGRFHLTQRGRLSQADGGAAFWLDGPIAAKFVELGAEGGSLGWPVSDELRPEPGVRRNTFQHGTISYREATGEVTVTAS